MAAGLIAEELTDFAGKRRGITERDQHPAAGRE